MRDLKNDTAKLKRLSHQEFEYMQAFTKNENAIRSKNFVLQLTARRETERPCALSRMTAGA